MMQSGGSYNKEPPLFFCVENKDVLIFLKITSIIITEQKIKNTKL